jgi:hypothetical protein
MNRTAILYPLLHSQIVWPSFEQSAETATLACQIISGLSYMMLSKATRAYFAQIGRKGGRKSRRTLTAAQARQMVAVRLARSAYRKFRALCFWSYRSDFEVTAANAAWVAEQLRRNGNRAAWRAASRIQSLLKCP